MKKTMFWLAAAALALGLVFGGCDLFDWLSGDEDEPEEAAGIVYSFDPKAEGMEPWQVVISLDEAYFRLPDIERAGYRLAYWYNLETGVYIPPGKRLLFSSPLWTRNCRFEAEWERLIYIIAYHEGGALPAPGNPFRYTVESEDIYLFPLTKEGWIFDGWYDNAACTGEPVTVIPKGSTGYKELWAKWVEAAINLSSPPASGTTNAAWDYSGGVYTVKNGANVNVFGSATSRRIVVESGAAATLTLNSATIDMSAASQSPAINASGANLTLVLTGNSTLKGSPDWPGVCTNNGGSVTIKGSGSLTAKGGAYGAGIGGSCDFANGTVIIESGAVNAEGGYGAGIGGGARAAGGTIIISGGTVNALSLGGSGDSAGIGGGAFGDSGDVSITGGSGTAMSYTGFAVGPGAGGFYGTFTGPDGGHTWPENSGGGDPYTWGN